MTKALGQAWLLPLGLGCSLAGSCMSGPGWPTVVLPPAALGMPKWMVETSLVRSPQHEKACEALQLTLISLCIAANNNRCGDKWIQRWIGCASERDRQEIPYPLPFCLLVFRNTLNCMFQMELNTDISVWYFMMSRSGFFNQIVDVKTGNPAKTSESYALISWTTKPGYPEHSENNFLPKNPKYLCNIVTNAMTALWC